MAKFPLSFGNLASYPDEEVKNKFLSSGTRMLSRVGKKLVEDGVLTVSEARSNKAGIAVSGDCYGTFWLANDAAVQISIGASLFGSAQRKDGVYVLAQYRTVRDEDLRKWERSGSKGNPPHPSQIIGGNMYLRSLEISDEILFDFVKKTALGHPECERIKVLRQAENLRSKVGDDLKEKSSPSI